MRRFFFSMLVFCFCSFLFSVDLSVLSDEKKVEYYRQALSIEVGSMTNTSNVFNAYNLGYGSVVAVGSGTSNTETVWTPFKGSVQISELEFFETVGEEKLAEQTRLFEESRKKNKNTAITLYCIGGVIGLAGLIVEAYPLYTNEYSDAAMRTMYTGLGLALGGSAIMAIGIPFDIKGKESQNISAQFVIGIADAYNQSLINKLK